MSKFKGTPGPWGVIVGKSNVAGVNSTFTIQSDERLSIASGQSQEHLGDDGIHEDEMLANARLIATAPELLDALDRLIADVERATHVEFGGTPWLKEKMAEIDYARAAIAKALREDAP